METDIGKEIDQDLLREMVRVFRERREADPVIIDWQHATSPFQGGSSRSSRKWKRPRTHRRS